MTAYAQLPFSATSPWRLGVADAATYAPDSDPRHAALATGPVWVNYDQYSVPITQAKATDPLATVTDLDRGTSIKARIPATARIAAGTDATMCIISPDGKTVADYWVTTRISPTAYTCRRRTETSLTGSGLSGGTRASGLPAVAGIIRAWEIKAGRIAHPLAAALRRDQLRKGWVWPATSEDGYADEYTGPIPMGSYLAIPRTVDLTTLGLRTKAAMLLARACQEFGVYVVDCAGAAVFAIEDDGDPTTAAFHAEVTGPDWTARDLPPIFAALRVVTNNTKATPNGGSAAERRLH